MKGNKWIFNIAMWLLKRCGYSISHREIEIEIHPVGLPDKPPTRYDIVASNFKGGFLGYCKSESQAEIFIQSFSHVIQSVKQSAVIKINNNERKKS